MRAHQWHSSNSKVLEVIVGAVVFGVVLEAALDPLEPAGIAWLGLAGGLATVGATVGWYLSCESSAVPTGW